MADTKELKRIKKIYGESFKNLCRDMFPDILEQEGTLLSILEKTFSHNCNFLYESITENFLETDFKELIYNKFGPQTKAEEQIIETRTPYEILSEAGYNLYECKTEEDIQSFRKYYASDEVLCTIYNGGRLDTRDCFFAVKKDVDEIKREEFVTPNKQDEYSTSVLGIQFTRDSRSTVQIISRYNHTVENPNCTLGNDLDRLAPGLKQSFANLLKERGMYLVHSHDEEPFEIPGYTLAKDGKYYKYNMEINGIYYCPDNIVISDGKPEIAIAPEKGIIMDRFCLNFESKTIKQCDDTAAPDSFVDDLQEIDRIDIEKAEKNDRIIKIHLRGKEKPVIIGIDKDNQIIKYDNQYLKQTGPNFLCSNKRLEELNLPELREIGDNFLFDNGELEKLTLPKLQIVGDGFLYLNCKLRELCVPKLQQVGCDFLYSGASLKELDVPKLKDVGSYFLFGNVELTKLNIPELESVEDEFLYDNDKLIELNAPKLQQVGDLFLCNNTVLKALNAPRIRQVGEDFLSSNTALTELDFPELQEAGCNFLEENEALTKVNIPKSPMLERMMKRIAFRNRLAKKTVSAVDIAKIDKENSIKTSEIKEVIKILKNRLKSFEKENDDIR